MNEQRRQILQMLAEGKISAHEAERLIDALEREQPESAPGAAPRPEPRPKYLRVVVGSAGNFGSDGPGRVNVRVPLRPPGPPGRAAVRPGGPPQAFNPSRDATAPPAPSRRSRTTPAHPHRQ